MIATNPKSKTQNLKLSLLLPILVLALVGGFLAARLWPAAPPALDPAITPINSEIEARWGIRITQIGVTADGGMVDFRYIVLDPDKALAMLQDLKNLPTLTAEDSGMVVSSAALMAPKHNLTAGRTYFLLYRNTRGAIKPGGAVSVVFDDLRLEHVVAK